LELLGGVRPFSGGRGERDHEERHERVSRRRFLLSAQQQVGRAQSARVSLGAESERSRVRSRGVQTRGRATPVWRHHRWTNRKRQGVLLLQLRSAETQLPGSLDLLAKRIS